ncbi:MAG: hypothetical protein Q4D17_00555 [Planctomycetia bacterium]|nr:hypothetical protein [Planctomycetia bacterium]
MKHTFKFILYAIMGIVCAANAAYAYTAPEIQKLMANDSKRHALLIDTTESTAPNKETYLDNISARIEKLGIDRNNIHKLTYSGKKATEENIINELMNLFTGKKSGSVEELMIFLTAYGISNGKKDFIVPAGVNPEEIESTEDTRLISIDDTLYPKILDSGAKRVLFVINFKSVRKVTRGAGNNSNLQNVNLETIVAKAGKINESYSDNDTSNEDNDEDDSSDEGKELEGHQILFITTKDQDTANQNLSQFYPTLIKALEGHADITGDNDGFIEAEEIPLYFSKNTSIQIMNNKLEGNTRYVLGKAEQKVTIPEGLFLDIAKEFTRDEFQPERDSAIAREKKISSKSSEEINEEVKKSDSTKVYTKTKATPKPIPPTYHKGKRGR